MLDQREVLRDNIAQLNGKLSVLQDRRNQINAEMKPIKDEIAKLKKEFNVLDLTVGSKWIVRDGYYGNRNVTLIYVDASHVVYLDAYKNPNRATIESFLGRAKRSEARDG